MSSRCINLQKTLGLASAGGAAVGRVMGSRAKKNHKRCSTAKSVHLWTVPVGAWRRRRFLPRADVSPSSGISAAGRRRRIQVAARLVPTMVYWC